MLVETHSWKHYPARVRATHDAIVGAARPPPRNGARWLDAARTADGHGAATRRHQRAARATRPPTTSAPIEFRGYAYRRDDSRDLGGIVTRYDETKPQIWSVPLYDEVVPAVSVDGAARRLPRAGGARGVGRRRS